MHNRHTSTSMSNDYGNPVASLGVGGLPYDLPRQLVVHWDPTLIALSWFVSFLGAYAASQVRTWTLFNSQRSFNGSYEHSSP